MLTSIDVKFPSSIDNWFTMLAIFARASGVDHLTFQKGYE